MPNDPGVILLVEDDPHDVELTLRALRNENLNLRVEIARDGEEALDYLFRRGQWRDRPSDRSPNLVLMDLKLPKIGGLQVLDEVRGCPDCAAIPIVVLTSSGEHRDIVESYRAGGEQLCAETRRYNRFPQSGSVHRNLLVNRQQTSFLSCQESSSPHAC